VNLSVRGLSVAYRRNNALAGVSFELRTGGLLLVLGPNGAGKSTLVRAIAGAVPIARGSVLFDGLDVTSTPAYRRVGKGVALVPEGRGVLAGLTVRENLELGWHGAPAAVRGSRDAEFDRVIRLFPILRERFEADCRALSGGEMQMLAIARALLAHPRLLLLDEPSLGLAPRMVSRVYEALGHLNASGLTMVLVEQKAVPLDRPADTTLVLQRGSVISRTDGVALSAERLAELYLSVQRESA
jgi:branched-chain amino acid transport system ATP-binding protein